MPDDNPYARPTSIVGKTLDSINEDGYRKTAMRGVRLVQKRDPTGIIGPALRPIHNLRTGFLVDTNLGLTVSAPKLLENQFKNGELTRCDACLMAEAIGGNETGEMVYETVAEHFDHLPPLSEIDRNLEESERLTPVKIAYTGALLDPEGYAHQFTGRDDPVDVKVTGGNRPEPVTRKKLSNCLQTDIYRQASDIINRHLLNTGYLFQVVIWPPAMEFESEITEIINSQGRIRYRTELQLEEQLRPFLRDLYETQHSVVWEGIWDKYEVLSEYPPKVIVLFIELPDASIREGTSHQMRHIKETARSQLHHRLDHGEISYTCILHATDNFEHNQATWKTLSDYLQEDSASLSSL